MMEASHWKDYCKHILGDLCKYNVQLISGTLPSECMKWVTMVTAQYIHFFQYRTAYQVSSIVVRSCPKLIYSKVTNNSLY